MNSFLPEFLSKYGVKGVTIPPEKVVNLDFDKLTDRDKEYMGDTREGGSYFPILQEVVVYPNWQDGKVHFMQILIHELMHLNSFQSLELNEDSDSETSFNTRRLGLNIRSRDKDEDYFRDVDEAVIEELALRFARQYFPRIPQLQNELALIERLRNKEGGTEIVSVTFTENLNGYEVSPNKGAYRGAREDLNEGLKKIFLEFPNEFSNTEEVFTVFARAAMTGNILPLARLIEKVFGKGSFRKVGERSAKSHL